MNKKRLLNIYEESLLENYYDSRIDSSGDLRATYEQELKEQGITERELEQARRKVEKRIDKIEREKYSY